MSVILAEHEIVENKILLHKCIKFRDRARDRARTRFFFFKYLSSYEKIAFILNLLDDDIEKYIHISKDTGEVLLKVDSLISLSKENLAQSGLMHGNVESLFPISANYGDNAPDIRCSNCKQYYDPRYYKGRRCPNCGTVN